MIKETYTVREVYLEPSRTSAMELFAKIERLKAAIFAKKPHHGYLTRF